MMEEPTKAPLRLQVASWPWAVLSQIVGVGLVVLGVALVFAVSWAVLVGGVLLLAAGSMAESAQLRTAAVAWKRQQNARARRAA